MAAVIQHPAYVDAQRREAASRLHDFTSTVEGIVTALVEARFRHLPAEARDGIVAMACLNVAARASGRASVALGTDPLEDWRSAATLGDAIIGDALKQAARL